MYARVARIEQFPEGAIDDAVQLMAEREAGRKDAPGYEGSYFLVDRQNGKGLVIVLWTTEADLRAHTSVAQQGEQVARAAGWQSPGWEVYEVGFHSR